MRYLKSLNEFSRTINEDYYGNTLNQVEQLPKNQTKKEFTDTIFAQMDKENPNELIIIEMLKEVKNNYYTDGKVEDLNFTNNLEQTPLIKACANKLYSVFKYLISKPEVNVNAIDKKGRNCLHFAVYNDDTRLTKNLLERPEIDVNLQSLKDKKTPLIIAAREGYSEIVQMLLNRSDIDVNVKKDDGICALSIAIINNNISIVEMLLNHSDIDVNSQSNKGYTPLMIATEIGRPRMVRWLLQRKDTEENIVTNDGKTAWTVARKHIKEQFPHLYKKIYG